MMTSLLLGFAPSLYDSVADFLFALEEERRFKEEAFVANSSESLRLSCSSYAKLTLTLAGEPGVGSYSFAAYLTYLFITLPGLMSAVTGLHRYFGSTKVCSSEGSNAVCRWTCRAVRGVASFLFLAALFYFLVVLSFGFHRFFYYSAILSTTMVLGVKILAVFVHGPEMKKLSTRTTAAESQYESSLQLLLVFIISMMNRNFTTTRINALVSSILVIGKSGAESYLTFGQDNLLEKCGPGFTGLLKKLKLLATYAPVFTATALYRLSATGIIITWEPGMMGMLIGITIAILFGLLLLIKMCKLDDLTLADLLEGVVREITTHTLWGERGREGSRKIQLFVAVYMTTIHTIFLALVANAGQMLACDCKETFLCKTEIRLPVAISCMVFGWLPRVVLSIPLWQE